MQKNYNENLVAGAAIRDDKGRRISKLFEASHPKMTVGYAKNLIMPDNPTEQEFNFRKSGSGVIEDGVAVIDKVKGKSVVWNQLRKDYLTGTNFGVVMTQIGNSVTIKGTVDSTPEYNQLLISVGVRIKRDGTKYLYLLNKSLGASWGISGYGGNYPANQLYGFFSTNEGTDWTGDVFRQTNEGDVIDIEGLIVQLINLTQMFGAGNEPSTVEEFLSRKPKVADEYAYNEGTIVNNKVEKVKTTGVNLWDEQWESGDYSGIDGEPVSTPKYIRCKNFIDVFPSTTYCISSANNQGTSERQFVVYFYDSNKKFISYLSIPASSPLFTSPANCRYIQFRNNIEDSTYNHDICINLSDPAINGQYAPYEKHELDLSWIKEIKDAEGVKLFEDGLKSAGTAFDEVRKNKAVKRVGSVDLGTISWSKVTSESAYGGYFFYGLKSDAIAGWSSNIISPLFDSISGLISDKDNTISINSQGYFCIQCSRYNDAAAFKTAMSGVMAYYELAAPIEVEYDEKNLTYPVVAGGTEEAIASEPSTTFRADIGYGIDAVKTILDLKARVEALEGK